MSRPAPHAFFGLAIFNTHPVQRLKQRLGRVFTKRRVTAEQARCRQKHGELIAAWERFYETWATAATYFHEARDGRLPREPAWPWFRHHLSDQDSPKVWPVGYRDAILGQLERIDHLDQGEIPPASKTFDDLAMACLGLRDWITSARIKRLIGLYRCCGMAEPSWQDRVSTLSKEELEADPPPMPPAAPPRSRSTE